MSPSTATSQVERAEIDDPDNSFASSPLGSLRDLINQKTAGIYATQQDSSIVASKDDSLTKSHSKQDQSSHAAESSQPSGQSQLPNKTTRTTGYAEEISGSTQPFGVGAVSPTDTAATPHILSATNDRLGSKEQPTTDGLPRQDANVSNKSHGKGSGIAGVSGIGTGVGLAGSYDFLRVDGTGKNDAVLEETSGPEHIEPPPGSREPPVSKSTSSRNDNDNPFTTQT